MQPKLLILDEPSSQLDPIAAREFLENVRKINLELGTTIIITEHNLEEVYGYADKVMLMEEGTIKKFLPPQEMAQYLATEEHEGMYKALPTPMRVHSRVENSLSCPLTVRDGRVWLEEFSKETNVLRTRVCITSQYCLQFQQSTDPKPFETMAFW